MGEGEGGWGCRDGGEGVKEVGRFECHGFIVRTSFSFGGEPGLPALDCKAAWTPHYLLPRFCGTLGVFFRIYVMNAAESADLVHPSYLADSALLISRRGIRRPRGTNISE